MTLEPLTHLERQISRLLKGGVALSAVVLLTGLACWAAGVTSAENLLTAGLILMMIIPVARIVASFVDAVRRSDRLLAWSTGIVLFVLAGTLLYSLRAK